MQLGSCIRSYRLDSQLVQIMLEANLSFSALLLAVMGIFVALYVRAQHTEWRFRFKVLLIICVGAFLVGIFNCSISLMLLIGRFPSASTEVFNLIVSLFFCEVAILAFAGLFLITTVVTS